MTETPRPTVSPGQPIDALWQRLAEAQDAALVAGRSSSGVDPVPTVRGLAARRSARRLKAGALVLVLGAAAAGIALYMHNAPLRVQLGRDGQPGTQGDALVADARSDLPLLFSDGSTVTFRAGAVGRMQRLTAAGAELEIEKGRLEAHVVHAAATVWLVHAGPYRVRVTGTRFLVDWTRPRLNVAVYQGSVVVDGGALGAGVPLHAGQQLTVHDGVVRVEALPAGSRTGDVSQVGIGGGASAGRAVALAPGPGAGARMSDAVESVTGPAPGGSAFESVPAEENDAVDVDGSAPAAGRTGAGEGGARAPTPRRAAGSGAGARPAEAVAARDREWLPPAERGEYAEALGIARGVGWSGLCARLDARRLLMLGDVARYAGASREAGTAWKALVQRFPDNRLAADAVFSLGRLAFDADRPREAATWFRLYVRRWPSGPMVDQATGRLMECAVRMDNDVVARGVAREYLARAPRGPHAPLANKILGGREASLGSGPNGAP